MQNFGPKWNISDRNLPIRTSETFAKFWSEVNNFGPKLILSNFLSEQLWAFLGNLWSNFGQVIYIQTLPFLQISGQHFLRTELGSRTRVREKNLGRDLEIESGVLGFSRCFGFFFLLFSLFFMSCLNMNFELFVVVMRG